MSKPWSERPLWEKVWLDDRKVHLAAARIIGYAGCTPFVFYDAAKLLPGYVKHRFESAIFDLTDYQKRSAADPRYELTALAKKVLRPILGPAPDSPEYAQWWRQRLISVAVMREQGTEPTHAVEPPVPLPWQAEKKRPAGKPKKPAPKEHRKPPKKKPKRAG